MTQPAVSEDSKPVLMLPAALWWASKGIPVFPLHNAVLTPMLEWACSCGDPCRHGSPAKHPRTQHGLHDASTDVATITGWWERWPEANIGLRTGIAFDLLDIDGPAGFDALKQMEEQVGTPQALCIVESGRADGGRHYYMAPAGLGTLKGGRTSPVGIDVKSKDAYVVAPPSQHVSGFRYTMTKPYAEIDGGNWEALHGWLTESAPKRQIDAVTAGAEQAVPREDRTESWCRRAAAWCAAALRGVSDQLASMGENTGRNDYLNDQTWRMLRYALGGHLDTGEVLDTMRDAAQRSGLYDGEIDGTLRSALRGADRDGPLDPPVEETTVDEIESFADLLLAATESDQASVNAVVMAALPIIDWHALWADEDEEEWIVEPLLPARRLVALYSAPKMGKSLLMLELAAAICAGRTVLGTDIDRPRRVLYVDFENDPKSDVRERLQAMGYAPADLDNLCYLSFPTLAALDSERGSVELMAAVSAYECEVVVVDTVSRAVSGDENENDTWLAFYRHTGLKLKQAGVSLVRLDHSGKDETKGQRGGSAKSGDVDAVWRLTRVADDTYKLICEASRMPVSEKELTIHRKLGPLRHQVDATGWAGANQAAQEALIRLMDAAELPSDAGARRAMTIKKEHGIVLSRKGLEEAVKRRQERTRGVGGTWVPEDVPED